ncbi:hypothetical protein D3C85_1407300 [compost metagenome]
MGHAHGQEGRMPGGIGFADPCQGLARVGEAHHGARRVHLECQAVDKRFAVVHQHRQDGVMEDRQVPVMRAECHGAIWAAAGSE